MVLIDDIELGVCVSFQVESYSIEHGRGLRGADLGNGDSAESIVPNQVKTDLYTASADGH